MPEIQIKGLSEIKKALTTLPKNIQERVLQNATTAAARKFVAQAQSNAPKDSGDLAKSISARKSKTQTAYEKAASVKPRKTKGVSPYYWRWVEFGTVKQRPQPFLRPAFDSGVNDASEEFRKAILRGLKRYAKPVN